MSHTLHRRGTPESLKGDFVVFAIAAQTVNAKGTAPKFAQFYDIAKKYSPRSMGDMRTGNNFACSDETIHEGFRDNSIVHAVFTDEETVAKLLGELKEAQLSLSIVVSGLLEATAECCHKNDMEPHTVEYSLGIWGKTECLPGEAVLEINTMCGHGMIAFGIIEKMIDEVKAGRSTAHAAAEKLAGLCHCGIFNPARAERIIESLSKDK